MVFDEDIYHEPFEINYDHPLSFDGLWENEPDAMESKERLEQFLICDCPGIINEEYPALNVKKIRVKFGFGEESYVYAIYQNEAFERRFINRKPFDEIKTLEDVKEDILQFVRLVYKSYYG